MAETYYAPGYEIGYYNNTDFNTGSSGSNWWDNNGATILGFGTQLINGLLNFGSNIYAVNHGQQPTSNSGGSQGSNVLQGPQQAPQAPQQPNYLLWVIVTVVVLVILMAIFLIVKNNTGGTKA
jgi:hypothetical protein